MKKYFLDTNVLIEMIRDSESWKRIAKQHGLNDSGLKLYTSYASSAELLAISKMNAWGNKKLEKMDYILKNMEIITMKGNAIRELYAEIDAYSRGKHPDKKLPKGQSAFILGKNDLWIAASAAHFKIPLLTADYDFELLNNVFLEVIIIPPMISDDSE